MSTAIPKANPAIGVLRVGRGKATACKDRVLVLLGDTDLQPRRVRQENQALDPQPTSLKRAKNEIYALGTQKSMPCFVLLLSCCGEN